MLPSYRPQDLCDFQTTVTLTSNLACTGLECVSDALGVFEVEAGVHYEYIEPKCVHMPFYDDAAKVFAQWSNDVYMCADKRTPSAMATCVGGYNDRHPGSTSKWADVLGNFREEKLTYEQNEDRCADWGVGRSVGDAQVGYMHALPTSLQIFLSSNLLLLNLETSAARRAILQCRRALHVLQELHGR